MSIFYQYDQNNPLVLAQAKFLSPTPTALSVPVSRGVLLRKKTNPRSMEGGGEDDGAEDPAAGGAQHQLRTSSGGGCSPGGAKPWQGGLMGQRSSQLAARQPRQPVVVDPGAQVAGQRPQTVVRRAEARHEQ